MNSTDLSRIQALLAGQSGPNGGTSLLDTNAIIKALMPITIIATAVSILIAFLYLLSIIQRVRADRAIIESRDILREMNAREKAKESPPTLPVVPSTTDQ